MELAATCNAGGQATGRTNSTISPWGAGVSSSQTTTRPDAHAEDVASKLSGVAASIKVCPAKRAEKGRQRLEGFACRTEALASSAPEWEPTNTSYPKRQTLVDQLVALAVNATSTVLFHDEDRRPYVSTLVNGHRETYRLPSQGAYDFITHLSYRSSGRVPSKAIIEDAMRALGGRALYDGETHSTHIRNAPGADGSVYIDVCDTERHIVQVTADGWRTDDAR
jgi:hypothetical protein